MSTRRGKVRIAVGSMGAALFISCHLVLAGSTTVWQSATDDWFTSTNWSGGVPSSSSTAEITNGGTAQINAAGAAASLVELGLASGQQGTIGLSTGGTLTASTEEIGVSGTGTFTQSGGATNNTFSLTLGENVNSSGSYTLADGTLNATNGLEAIGGSGSGMFIQNGGTNNVNTLNLGNGTYALNNGALSAAFVNYSSTSSSLLQTGGTFTFQNFDQEGGTLTAGGVNSALPSPLVLGSGGIGNSFAVTGGTLNSQTITLNALGSLNVSGGGTLNCTTLNVNGGDLIVPSIVLDTGSPVFSVPIPAGGTQPTINFSSGMLDGQAVYLGTTNNASASFTQSIPVAFGANSLAVGYAPGSTATYTLPAGQSLTSFGEIIGFGGTTGHFIQTGGSNSTQSLTIYNGTAVQSGGTFVGDIVVINGSYTQSGGSNELSSVGTLQVGDGNGTATFNLSSNGSISGFGTEDVAYNAPGTFNQTGGSNVGNELIIGFGGSFPGVYTLSGGTLALGGLGLFNGSFIVENDSASLGGTFNGGTIDLAGATSTAVAGELLDTLGYRQTGALDVGIGGAIAGTGSNT